MRQLKISKQITNRESPSLDKYLHEIGQVPLLTSEEEVELAKLIRAGNQEAFDKLVSANLRFVVSVAKQYQNQGLNLVDLVSVGNNGLLKAALRYDETRGFKFISYAVWWIRQGILQSLAEQGRIVRLPLNRLGSLNKLSRAYSLLEQKYGREPTDEELATELDISLSEVSRTLKASGRHVSVDAPFASGEENNLLDVLENRSEKAPDNSLINESLCFEIQGLLKTLLDKEASVLILFYGLNGHQAMTLQEIGTHLKLTSERVRQLKENAIGKLQNASRTKELKAFLG